jgi:CheY-like chemotaxis protein
MDELAGARVLVVDDKRDTLEILEMLIQSHGAETQSATSAAEGLARISRFHPDVLVCDLAMPGDDGHAFIRKVRSLPADRGGAVSALALSAHVYREDRERALAAGFDAFLPKPVWPRALVDCLRALRSRARGFVERRRGERRRLTGRFRTVLERRQMERRRLEVC